MQSRIDTLGDSVEYLDKLTGNVLSFEADPILQELAAQAAEMLKTPMALVSLVLRRTQHFRASYGLPPELEATKATDRATSFCQLVVRDEMPVLVSNAATDERIPQDLVHRYGLESYVGVPVTIGDTVVGSMCGLDVVQRAFTPQDVAKLRVIAKRASSRLTELASEQRPSFELIGKAADPAFSDIRNALVVLVTAPGFISTAVTELESLAALKEADLSDEARLRALGALPDVASTLQDLRDAAHELNKAAKRGARHGVPSGPAPRYQSNLLHHFRGTIGGPSYKTPRWRRVGTSATNATGPGTKRHRGRHPNSVTVRTFPRQTSSRRWPNSHVDNGKQWCILHAI
tara:strand:+ start:30922 stop:31959 length:1038 start_codon:yes stop_codon:yes gene_type:complete